MKLPKFNQGDAFKFGILGLVAGYAVALAYSKTSGPIDMTSQVARAAATEAIFGKQTQYQPIDPDVFWTDTADSNMYDLRNEEVLYNKMPRILISAKPASDFKWIQPVGSYDRQNTDGRYTYF